MDDDDTSILKNFQLKKNEIEELRKFPLQIQSRLLVLLFTVSQTHLRNVKLSPNEPSKNVKLIAKKY